MAIGIHLGWNWMLPLFGVNLSGFTMGLTGMTMRWNVGACGAAEIMVRKPAC